MCLGRRGFPSTSVPTDRLPNQVKGLLYPFCIMAGLLQDIFGRCGDALNTMAEITTTSLMCQKRQADQLYCQTFSAFLSDFID